LPDAAAFSRVFRGASKSRDDFFLILSKGNGKTSARLGLAISRKHCRLASSRNRVKRIVRESFRRHQSELGGVDIVVIGQSGISRAGNRSLFDSLDRHWQEIRRAG
jgi:ribonuclease P protein component